VEPAPIRRLDEQELVARAKRGDLVAYDELVKRYQERIYATVYHMTPTTRMQRSGARGFHRHFRHKTFKGGSSFYTWVYG